MTKNITLSIDEDVLKKVRILAAEKHTSVNALVRNHLNLLISKEQEKDEAREALLNLANEKAGDMGKQKWNREELYDR